MATVRIVPALEPLENSHAGLDLAVKAAAVEHLPLERSEEALGQRVGSTDRSGLRVSTRAGEVGSPVVHEPTSAVE